MQSIYIRFAYIMKWHVTYGSFGYVFTLSFFLFLNHLNLSSFKKWPKLKLLQKFLKIFNFSLIKFFSKKLKEFWAFHKVPILLGYLDQKNPPPVLKSSQNGEIPPNLVTLIAKASIEADILSDLEIILLHQYLTKLGSLKK